MDRLRDPDRGARHNWASAAGVAMRPRTMATSRLTRKVTRSSASVSPSAPVTSSPSCTSVSRTSTRSGPERLASSAGTA